MLICLFAKGRNVKLTPMGRMFLDHMEQAVTILDNANEKLRRILDPEQGTIRIGFPSSLATDDANSDFSLS